MGPCYWNVTSDHIFHQVLGPEMCPTFPNVISSKESSLFNLQSSQISASLSPAHLTNLCRKVYNVGKKIRRCGDLSFLTPFLQFTIKGHHSCVFAIKNTDTLGPIPKHIMPSNKSVKCPWSSKAVIMAFTATRSTTARQ